MDLEDIDDNLLNQLMDNFEQDSDKNEVKAGPQVQQSPGPEHLDVLSKFFGHQSFRPLQWEIISTIIHDRRDVCAIMSTGYGKSLCFQFPSMFLGGVTLVVSPLISLMEDQVLSLKVTNIPACLLGTAQKNQREVIDDIFKKKYKIVYVTPEFCTGDVGSDILKRMSKELPVILIAIDEAHCISSWGHDFRYHYRQLGILLNIFTQVPVIAVTATATPRVRGDIITNLKLRNPLCVCSGFDRPNIYFEVNVKGTGGVYSDFTKLMVHDGAVLKFSGPTIIYCITRKETEAVAENLKCHGLKCRSYHAGLSLKARQETHELFVKDKIDVVVATIAFGMGIDKPDIRNVVHYGCSKSIENYYQEVGRSGRDGLPAHCVTFYSNSDFQILRCLISKNSSDGQHGEVSLKKMEEYLTTLKCRRRFILEHFGDKVDHLDKPRNTCCDVCTRKLCDKRPEHEIYEGIDENGCYDFTPYAKTFLKAVEAFSSTKLGLGTFIKFVRGSSTIPENKKKHPMFGSGKGQSDTWWQSIARVLIHEKYLLEKAEKSFNGFTYTAISLTRKGQDMISCNERLIVPPPSTFFKLLKLKPASTQAWINTSRSVNLPSTSKKPSPETPTESQAEVNQRMALYRKLLDQRGVIASDLDCMPYVVASNKALMTLAMLKPKTMEGLRSLHVDGFTVAKLNKFGEKFLSVINSNVVTRNGSRSIRDVLSAHPLPEISLPLTAEISCKMAESGLTLGEIAEKRAVTKGTITSHLITGLKFGHPIKIAEFGVTEENRDAIIKVFRTFCKTGFTNVKITPIKEQLPPEITFDEIKAVLAYLQVRCHLQSLNVPYEEFEDSAFSEVCLEENKSETEVNTLQNKVNREEKKDQSHMFVEETQKVVESPAKKFKLNEKSDFGDILDSPPRQDSGVASVSDISEELNNTPLEVKKETQESGRGRSSRKSAKSKTKALPPWLVVKKIR